MGGGEEGSGKVMRVWGKVRGDSGGRGVNKCGGGVGECMEVSVGKCVGVWG